VSLFTKDDESPAFLKTISSGDGKGSFHTGFSSDAEKISGFFLTGSDLPPASCRKNPAFLLGGNNLKIPDYPTGN
jgi:hypothetical protein